MNFILMLTAEIFVADKKVKKPASSSGSSSADSDSDSASHTKKKKKKDKKKKKKQKKDKSSRYSDSVSLNGKMLSLTCL